LSRAIEAMSSLPKCSMCDKFYHFTTFYDYYFLKKLHMLIINFKFTSSWLGIQPYLQRPIVM
jgi:hypothetical protein